MNILLISTGGGGGNILRSLKALFARDVAIAHKTDAKFAERLRRAVTARFLDTNEFSLAQVPREERLLIGANTTRGLGSRHDPAVAARALEESRDQIERLIEKYSVVITIGTGGKGTGAGTMFPLAEIVRRQHKLILPVFVRPSFERHEVDKGRYDHALDVAAQFDKARIRLIEILNDRAYSDRDPQPQSVVWERMNLPIARGLRGLIYVVWDLSQVDPSDLSILLAGDGRMRIGFGEIDPPDGDDPSDVQIREAVDRCWHNPYCAFSKPAGTSLVCIQGDWSNLADAKIKSGIAGLALGSPPHTRYNPLYARAVQTPRPWGITALFTEYTGAHEPLTLQWTLKPSLLNFRLTTDDDTHVEQVMADDETVPAESIVAPPTGDGPVPLPVAAIEAADRVERSPEVPFPTVAEFAKALNRLDPVALELAAGGPPSDISIDGPSVKHLLGTFWFRSVFPRLSPSWRERLLDALATSVVIPNHVIWRGRQAVRLADARYDELKEIAETTIVNGAVGTDLQLLLAIARLWGEEAWRRLQFAKVAPGDESSRWRARQDSDVRPQA
jgi:cell division GTPase FtsZ